MGLRQIFKNGQKRADKVDTAILVQSLIIDRFLILIFRGVMKMIKSSDNLNIREYIHIFLNLLGSTRSEADGYAS